MTDLKYIESLRIPTKNDPLRVLVSSCLIGTLCGADGSSYGDYPHIIEISKSSKVRMVSFCPENFSFGTPREIPDIEGGNGADVLDGQSIVVNETGKDITSGMIKAAKKMLKIAQENDIELAIMMDVSAACGSQVIYKGHRLSQNPKYQMGMGVCSEMLKRNGFKIISQRDYKSLEILFSKINSNHIQDITARDHHETEWYKQYFKP